MRILISVLALVTTACAMPSATVPAGDRGIAHSTREGRVSLFPSDADVLSDEQILSVLAAKAALPPTLKLSVVHLQHKSAARHWGWRPELEADTRQELAIDLIAALASPRRVERVGYLPSFLLPEVPAVGHLREAAARYQTDAVFIFQTSCEIYERYRFFRAPQAKAICLVEGALLDVRTGIVPIAREVLREFEVSESGEDANFVETIRRAEAEALSGALRQLGSQVASWLEGSVP